MASNYQLEGDTLAWLLGPEDPGVRYLALRDLVGLHGEEPELHAAAQAAHTHGPIAAILEHMDDEGYWAEPGPGYTPKYRSTVWAIVTLAQLGATCANDERIAQACAYLAGHALTPGGQFTSSGTAAGTADCLQGNLCWALARLGYDLDRLAPAITWMARSVTGEGVAPREDTHAAVRYYAGKCGPNFACGANNQLPCAWGAIKVMLALSAWPFERRTPLIERAITQGASFLLDGDPAAAAYPSGYSPRPSRNWWKFGFPVFYVTDLLQNVEALANLGYGQDPRLAEALAIIRQKQDAQGRWLLEYDYAGKTWCEFGARGQPNKWVTLRALRALRTVGQSAPIPAGRAA